MSLSNKWQESGKKILSKTLENQINFMLYEFQLNKNYICDHYSMWFEAL
jgi:hypothetical protein